MTSVKIVGLEQIQRKLSSMSAEIEDTFHAGAEEASNRVILPTVGLQRYPPETEANRPPTPYYIRGRGTQTATRNYQNSERLGTRWVFSRLAGLRASIGNAASYAPYVHGENQARAMAPKGWRRLMDVADEKRSEIERVINAWFSRLVKKHLE